MPLIPRSKTQLDDGQELFDSLHVLSLDADERYLKDAAGTVHIDWSDPDFTAYHRPIWIYGQYPYQNYAIVLGGATGGIAVQYYPAGDDTLTTNQYTSYDPIGNAIYIGLSDGTNGFLVNKRLIAWQGQAISEGQTILGPAEVDFFPDDPDYPVLHRTDSTHFELYINDIRNFGASADYNPNIDLLNRKLYAVDGTTEVADWSSAGGIKFGTQAQFASESSRLYVDGLFNYNDDGNINIDLLNRKLYDNDGTTVVIDYNNGGPGSGVQIGKDGGADFPVIGVDWSSGSQINITTSATNYINLGSAASQTGGGSPNKITIGGTNLKIQDLATSDPHVVNQLWRSGNDIKISTG